MDHWPHKLESWAMPDILAAVNDADWQAFRVSLKGCSTQEKLIRLEEYRMRATKKHGFLPAVERCRIDNYINALKRGGQLTVDCVVQR